MKKQEKVKSVRINVKFAETTNKEKSVEALTSTPGVVDVIQTFPGETDKELASLYLVEVEEKDVKKTLQKLRKSPAIDYAEEVAPRKLIKQTGV